MPRYRKRPLIVEAEQWAPGKQVDGLTEGVYMYGVQKFYARLQTDDGYQGVHEGDYIITGVGGEQYACRPDIFEETYEPVTEDG